jgi:CheY-like chemotaxis protein/prolyl-tRNA editing enzyme YbaK/EbsC (Cys-tRNA(Pro) deacylase)
MSTPRWLRRIFDRYQVAYEERQHPPVYTASHLAHSEHVSGHRVAKTVLLAWDGHPVSVVLPASARLDLKQVQAVLGGPDLRFASEAEIGGWFKGCHPGAVPPVRLRHDHPVLMDRSLAHLGTLVFAAGTPQDAVAVRFRDWYRVVRPGVGRFREEVAVRPNNAKSPTVLVVEDEADTNLLLCRLLERAGYTCRGAVDGHGALALARELRPSAILMDLMLPDMSGFDVCERLRQVGPLQPAPVVIVTALDDEASRQRGWQLGAEGYLTKPFPPEALTRELQAIVADARA